VWIVLFQIIIIIFLCTILKNIHTKLILKKLIPLIPLIAFIIVINFMHGGGNIFFNIGPFYFIKQGLLRGIIYSGIVIELFSMSNILTEAFNERQTVAVIKGLKIWKRRNTIERNRIDFLIIIMYVLSFFKISYKNVPILLGKGVKINKKKLNDKLVYFLESSLKELQRRMDYIKDIDLPSIKFKLSDGFFILFQLLIIFIAIIFNNKVNFNI